MSLSAVMMAARQPPVTAVAMKMILRSTTKRLAAALAHFRSTVGANALRREGFEYEPRPHALSPTDPSRIPAYLRRRRLALRLQSRFDAQEAPSSMRAGVR
jgi:hypothetical protein